MTRGRQSCVVGSGMPLPATHLQSVQATVKMVNASELSLRGPRRGRGNLGKAVTISPMAFLLSNQVLRDSTSLRSPRNDKPVCLTPLNLCREYRQPPWRSLSAATDAIGAYRYNGSPRTNRRCVSRPSKIILYFFAVFL